MTTLEICAGAGGQSLGLEQAGFEPVALVENDAHACATLRANRPAWNVVEQDVTTFDGTPFRGVDLLAGGVPCPPFSVAGLQKGADDERDLFPQMLRLAEETQARAVMIENVRGLLDASFASYRAGLNRKLEALGYTPSWKLLNASDYGVPQLRPRVVIVALRPADAERFAWPDPVGEAPTVGETLEAMMGEGGWAGASEWAQGAQGIAPTLVGGSKKHGGPDLGPTRARKAWEALGVNGRLIANEPPAPDHDGLPYLTVRMAARIQGFPDEWQIVGRKTNAYRQVGNAFPPPVARVVARAIRHALNPEAVRSPSSPASYGQRVLFAEP